MAKIREIYTSDAYYPFLCYCESHGYEEMHDLVRCPFARLKDEPDITASLSSRIRVTFLAYLKAHPRIFCLKRRKPPPRLRARPKQDLKRPRKNCGCFSGTTPTASSMSRRLSRPLRRRSCAGWTLPPFWTRPAGAGLLTMQRIFTAGSAERPRFFMPEGRRLP